MPFSLAQSATKRSSFPMEIGFAFDTADTFSFTLALLRAYTAADCWKCTGLRNDLICFFKVSFFYFMYECRDIDGYRTSLHTFCIFTVDAARSFFHCFFLHYIQDIPHQSWLLLLLDACSLTGTFFNTSAIICHLRNFHIRHDVCHLHAVSEVHVPLLSCRESVSSLPHQNQSYDRQIPDRLRRQISLHLLP